MELFGIMKDINHENYEIFMINNKKWDFSTMGSYPYTYLKKHGNLSSIKECRLFKIKGCPDFSIVYGSSIIEPEFCDTHTKNIIKKTISNFYNLEGKNLKLWNPQNHTYFSIESQTYSCCRQLKRELVPVYKFLHSTQPAPIRICTASDLMTKYKISKNSTYMKVGTPSSKPWPPDIKSVKKFDRFSTFIERLKFLNNASLIYSHECQTDSDQLNPL